MLRKKEPLTPGPHPDSPRLQKLLQSQRTILSVTLIVALVGVGYLLYHHWHHAEQPLSPLQKPSIVKNDFWAGYLKYGPANIMTKVSGDWTVPKVAAATDSQLSASWIGIGGYVASGSIQVGTDSNAGAVNGTPGTTYDAFWKCVAPPTAPSTASDPDLPGTLPSAKTTNTPVVTPNNLIEGLKVNAGDTMQASIIKKGSSWVVTLNNKTNGQNFQKTVPCNADQSTSEWIIENVAKRNSPASNAALPRFNSISFSNLVVNKTAPGLTHQIEFVMTSAGKTIASPSALTTNADHFKLQDSR